MFALFDKFPVSKGNLRYFKKNRNTTFYHVQALIHSLCLIRGGGKTEAT